MNIHTLIPIITKPIPGNVLQSSGASAPESASSAPSAVERPVLELPTFDNKSYNIPAPPVITKDLASDQGGDSVLYESIGISGKFQPPSAYIRYRIPNATSSSTNTTSTTTNTSTVVISQPKTPLDIREIEYELTQDDIDWLKTHPKYGENGPTPLSEDIFEGMINLFETSTGSGSPVTPADVEKSMFEEFGIGRSNVNRCIDDIHAYWISKRNRLRKPLLRKFWPVTSSDDTNPNLTFRPREKERYKLRRKRGNDMDSFEKLTRLQRDFHCVLDMLELVKRRETLSWMSAKLVQDRFECSRHALLGLKTPYVRLLPRESNEIPKTIEPTNFGQQHQQLLLNLPSIEVSDMAQSESGPQSIKKVPGAHHAILTEKEQQRLRKQQKLSRKKAAELSGGMLSSSQDPNGLDKSSSTKIPKPQITLKRPDYDLNPPIPKYLLDYDINETRRSITKSLGFGLSVLDEFDDVRNADDDYDCQEEDDEEEEEEQDFDAENISSSKSNSEFVFVGRVARGGRIVIDRLSRKRARAQGIKLYDSNHISRLAFSSGSNLQQQSRIDYVDPSIMKPDFGICPLSPTSRHRVQSIFHTIDDDEDVSITNIENAIFLSNPLNNGGNTRPVKYRLIA